MKEGIKDIRGKKLEGYENTAIFEGFPYNFYEIKPRTFSEMEKKAGDALASALNTRQPLEEWDRKLPKNISKQFGLAFKQRIIPLVETKELIEKLPMPDDWEAVKKELLELVETYLDFVKEKELFVEYVLDHGIGFGYLGPLLRDQKLEEIMVNGTKRHVFIYHRKYGMCRTNIFIPLHDRFLLRLTSKAAKFSGRKFNDNEPLLDARLPDGSRLNATFENITPFGHSITIRKFTRNMLSIPELVGNGTLTSELASFLWVMGEGMRAHPMNVIITGGSGCGKTTMLNALTSFIPYRERVISIEDTLELKMYGRENWISMESKPPTKNGKGTSMNDLLTNAMRMRPDRLIVGEVRSKEAQTLFIAMDTGHEGCAGTLHSNSAREMILRLTNEPMNVPKALLPLLDMIVVMQKIQNPEGKLLRRVAQVAEVCHLDQNVLLSNIYEREPETDTLIRTDTPSHLLQSLSEIIGKSKREIIQEIKTRQRIIEWMVRHKITSTENVEQIIQQYYFDASGVLEQVDKEP
jgi:flagellar protein FlaI